MAATLLEVAQPVDAKGRSGRTDNGPTTVGQSVVISAWLARFEHRVEWLVILGHGDPEPDRCAGRGLAGALDAFGDRAAAVVGIAELADQDGDGPRGPTLQDRICVA